MKQNYKIHILGIKFGNDLVTFGLSPKGNMAKSKR